MNKHTLLCASLVLALGTPASAIAADKDEIASLRAELQALKASYAASISALETRVVAAETEARNAQRDASVATGSAVAATRSATEASAGAVPPPVQNAPTSDSAFNPAISLTLSGTYSHTSRDPANYAIAGFPVAAGAEIGPGPRSFSLGESELGIAANIDPYFRGVLNLALSADNEASVEEAYFQTLQLGSGLTARGGRFLSGIGYLNSQHAHTWDFVDAPLAYQALLGGQYREDGVELRWLAPLDTYLEFGAELGRGGSFPGTGPHGNSPGAAALFVHSGGDIGESHSWSAGLSWLRTNADGRETPDEDLLGSAITNAFTGHSEVWIADAVWKWAPEGNATRTHFKLQGEYLRRRESGQLTYDTAATASTAPLRSTQSGWYLQGIYQFVPGWRVGVRGERLDVGHADFGANANVLALPDYQPSRISLMTDYSLSEFSRFRLQFSQDRAREGEADKQLFLQYQMSLGAHGAHTY